jgi:hypothetical protein
MCRRNARAQTAPPKQAAGLPRRAIQQQGARTRGRYTFKLVSNIQHKMPQNVRGRKACKFIETDAPQRISQNSQNGFSTPSRLKRGFDSHRRLRYTAKSTILSR